MAQVIFDEGLAPSTPATNKLTLYAKTDGKFYYKDDAGVETLLTPNVYSAFIDSLLNDSSANEAKITLEVITAATGSTILPSGTTAQRDVSPAGGYLRFNATLGQFEGYNGISWGAIGGGATGGGGDKVFVENGQTVTTDYTLTTNYNAHSVGPITINTGITVTVPSGSTWLVS